MDIQSELITAVKCLIRLFSTINRIGSNIWIGLPDYRDERTVKFFSSSPVLIRKIFENHRSDPPM